MRRRPDARSLVILCHESQRRFDFIPPIPLRRLDEMRRPFLRCPPAFSVKPALFFD
jgi:hypothetical protein